MKRGRPIKPEEIKLETREIPTFVFDIFNDMLVDGTVSETKDIVILTKDVRKRIEDHLKTMEDPPQFELWWLDVENMYRAAGWTVTYDKPAYCETHDASYTFTHNKKRKGGCPKCDKTIVHAPSGIAGLFDGDIKLCLDTQCGWNSAGIKFT